MAWKTALSALWIYTALCFVLPLPGARLGQAFLGLMALGHVIEFAVALPTLRRAPGGPGHHFVPTVLFGFLHIREVKARLDASPAA